MTAEVAILNKAAVAIAADSAVTISTQEENRKIFTSANKIFSLSKHHPVGVMIYGGAEFMTVPWEILIKLFRQKLGNKKYQKLSSYGREFVSFLKSSTKLFPDDYQEFNFLGCGKRIL